MKILYAFSFFHIIQPTHLTLLQLVTKIVYGESTKYEDPSHSTCNRLFIACVMCTDSMLRNLFSNTV